MAETEQTKVCPLCAETIKAAAKICPYCHKKQGRLFFVSQFDLLAIATMVIILATAILCVNLITGGRNFSSFRDKVVVLESQLSVDVVQDHTNVIVTGTLTNASNYTWNIDRFEIRFFDKSGRLVDVDASSSQGYSVLPHSDHSIHVTLYSRRSIPDHANYKVIVTSATEPGLWLASE